METENDRLYEAAKAAIDALFSDRSVSVAEARENLRSLMGEIEIMLESLGGE
jgi:hypothetical protein